MKTNEWLAAAETKLENYKTYINQLPDDPTKAAHQSCRNILVAILDFAPNDEGRCQMAKYICSASSEEALKHLGTYIRINLIVPFKAHGGRTPEPSSHPSRPLANLEREDITSLLEHATRDSRVLKRLALERDNYRCLASNMLDEDIAIQQPHLLGPDDFSSSTAAAHIIPFSLCNASTDDHISRNSAIWQMIRTFSGIEVAQLNGNRINSLDNVMTLTPIHHSSFGQLKLWFEPFSDQSNQYRVRTRASRLVGVVDGQLVTFTSSKPGVPLPNREYLALHAACAKVAHASGAAEEIDEFWGKWEDTKVLAADGSSFGLLEEAFLYRVPGISAQNCEGEGPWIDWTRFNSACDTCEDRIQQGRESLDSSL